MIVVAIIGLLAAIAIPNFVRARETSQKNACINNLRQIDGAVQQWALENKANTNAPVGFADVDDYLRNEVTCPNDSANAFGSSYTLSTVNVKPVCQIRPDTHKLPIDTVAP